MHIFIQFYEFREIFSLYAKRWLITQIKIRNHS